MPGGAAQSLGNRDGQQCGKRDVPESRGAPKRKSQLEPCSLAFASTVTEGKSVLLSFASVNGNTSVGLVRSTGLSTHLEDCQIEITEQ